MVETVTTRQRASDAILFIALGVSLALNVCQYYSRVNITTTATSRAELPSGGEKIHSVHVVSAGGSAETITLDAGHLPTVVYVMSPDCKWCQFNLAKVNKLAADLRGSYNIVGLSSHFDKTSTMPKYSFPIYTPDPRYPSPDISLDATPRTLLFSPDGRLLKAWDGAYINDTQKQVSTYFHAGIPDS